MVLLILYFNKETYDNDNCHFETTLEEFISMDNQVTISIQDEDGMQLGLVNSDLNRKNQLQNFGQYDPHYWVVDVEEIRKTLYPICQNQKKAISEMKFLYKIKLSRFVASEDTEWSCHYFSLYTKIV